MNPDEQKPAAQPTSMTGSEWQRQAVIAARAGAAAQKQNVAAPGLQAARERAAAQDVPDMLAAVDPVTTQQQQPAGQQQAQPQPAQPQMQGVPAGQPAGQPIVSGALAPDVPEVMPVVGTGGTSTGKKVLIAIFILILVLSAAAAGYSFFIKDKQGGGNTSQQDQDEQGERQDSSAQGSATPAQVAARNARRLTDANQLLASTSAFAANNNGRLPTGYSDGSLVGSGSETPLEVSFEYYQTIQVKAGNQDSLETDELWLVTGAQCDADNTGSVVASDTRSVAVLYGYENDTGSFEGRCVAG